jgi:hypothetical protein
MTSEGLEELLLVDGVLVWPPEESIASPLRTSIPRPAPSLLLHQVFSHTLEIVPADSVPAKEKA